MPSFDRANEVFPIRDTLSGGRPMVASGSTPEIDRNSPTPLYHQVYLVLLAKIQAGEWKPGDAIPTEKELTNCYNLSRTTIRQTLQQLVLDGYLFRRQGRGTFVANPKVRHGPQRPFGLTGYLRTHGLRPGWRLLDMRRVVEPGKAAVSLELAEDQDVLEIRRLRLANDEAIGLHIAYVPFPLAEKVKEEYLTQGDSSLFYLEQLLGITLSESHRLIEAVPAGKSEARLLHTKVGSPLLVVRRTTIAADGRPVEYLNAAYLGERFEYYVHLQH